MQAKGGSEGVPPLILNLGTKRGWVVGLTPRPLYQSGKSSRSLMNRGWVGLNVLEKWWILPFSGLELQKTQLVPQSAFRLQELTVGYLFWSAQLRSWSAFTREDTTHLAQRCKDTFCTVNSVRNLVRRKSNPPPPRFQVTPLLFLSASYSTLLQVPYPARGDIIGLNNSASYTNLR
jgi:hypothetical protein